MRREYLAPAEIGGAPITVPSEMPGSFPSVSVAGGQITGINIPQPGDLTNHPDDLRAGTANTMLPPGSPIVGLPIWYSRIGAVGEFVHNVTMDEAIPDDTTSLFAWGFTPQLIFGIDNGGGPGALANDGIADFAPFFGGGTPGDFAFYNVTFFGADNDPSGVTDGSGAFTPHVNIYEGGAPFDVNFGGGAGLDETDLDHDLGPAGSVGTPTLDAAVDGDLLLTLDVRGPSTGMFTFSLEDLNGDGQITPGVDAVRLTVTVNIGSARVTGGKLVDERLVSLGSTVTGGSVFISCCSSTPPTAPTPTADSLTSPY